MNTKNIWKKITRRENRAKVVASGGAFFVVFLFLGFIGILITLNVFFTMPFILGMVNGSQGGSIVDRTKTFWGNRSKGQKVGIAFGFIILIPFIMIGFMWLITMGTAFAIDLLIILPIALLVGFFVFRNPQRQTNAVSRFFGHPAVGVIAIIGVVAIMVIVGLNYVNAHQYDTARTNFADYGKPLHDTPSDYNTIIQPFFNETSGQWENTTLTVPRLADTVLFKVVDDFFYEVGFVTYLNQTSDNLTSTSSLYDTDGQLPVDNAKISLACYDVAGNQLLNIGGITESQGLCSFNKVPFGIYELTVDASGYLKFNYEIHINENYTIATVIVHMKPIYYKVALDYMFSVEEPYSSSFLLSKVSFSDAYIYVDAKFMGGLNAGDLKNLKRQQSWYGWSGMPYIPSLSNSILKLYSQEQQIFQQMQGIWGYIGGVLLGIPRYQNVQEIHYSGHKVDVQDVRVIDAEAFEYDTFWKQLPTPNVEKISEEQMAEYLAQYNEFQLNTTDDGNPEYYFDEILNDTSDRSILPQRRYEYIIWSEVPDSNSIRMQFNVTTYYTRTTDFEAQVYWFQYGEETEDVIVDWIDVEVTFENKIPTVETPIVGG